MSDSNVYPFHAPSSRRFSPPPVALPIGRAYPPQSEFQKPRYVDTYCAELDRKRVQQKQRSIADRIILISLVTASAGMACFTAYGVWQLLQHVFAEVL